MSYNNTKEADDSPVAVLADYDHCRTDYHGDDVDEEEEVCKASRYCQCHGVLAGVKAGQQERVAGQTVVKGPELVLSAVGDTYCVDSRGDRPADRSIGLKFEEHLPRK